MNKLLIFDGNAVLHRAYHALPPLTTSSGEPINAVYGMVSMLLGIVSELQPSHIAFAFDREEPTFRKKEYANYQSHRPPTEDGLSSQFSKARDVLEKMKIPSYDKAGYEADDIIGTLSVVVPANKIVIVTGDRDQFQLVNDRVSVFMPMGGMNRGKVFNPREVKEKMGVPPEQIVDYKALVGDPSDNYPGVLGIGPKTAIKLLESFGSYPEVYKHLDDLPESTKVKLLNGKAGGDVSYKLAKIITEVDFKYNFEDMGKWKISSEEATELFNSFGFKTLTRRVASFGMPDTSNEEPFYKKKLTYDELKNTAVLISKRLKGKNYAIRGTASMVLQGLDMGVDDVDVLCDKAAVEYVNSVFKDELFKKSEYSESDKFRSYFGRAVIAGVLVEFIGEWQIKKSDGNWTEKIVPNKENTLKVDVDGCKVVVTNLDLELKNSSDMGRWNEYHKIKKQLEEKDQQSLF